LNRSVIYAIAMRISLNSQYWW